MRTLDGAEVRRAIAPGPFKGELAEVLADVRRHGGNPQVSDGHNHPSVWGTAGNERGILGGLLGHVGFLAAHCVPPGAACCYSKCLRRVRALIVWDCESDDFAIQA